VKDVGEPCAGEPHARFDGRGLETERHSVTAPVPDPTKLLLFEDRAADRYGDLVAERRGAGRRISVPDAIIASITWANRAALATRNVADFSDCAIEIVNPYDS
jgi:predicted nucleic acid-binding protein